MIETTVKDLREQLCKVGKRLFDAGLVTGTSGNVSARIPNTDRVLIKPSGTCLQTLRLEDFIMVDLQGRKLKGQGVISLEGPMHAAVCRVRSDVNGIVHSHAPTATAFGIVGLKIIPMTVESFKFIPKGVPMVPFEGRGQGSLLRLYRKKS